MSTSKAQKQIHANELLALKGLETDENGNKVAIDLPINLPEELQSSAYEFSPTLKTMMVDHNGSKEPPQGQEQPEPLRPVSSVPQAPSVSTLPGPTNVPQSITKPSPGAKRGRPTKLSRTLKMPVANKNKNVPVTGPATQASKPVASVLGRKRGRTSAKSHLVGASLPPLQPNRQGAKNAPQSHPGANDPGGSQGRYNNVQASAVGVYSTPATYAGYQREWEHPPPETRYALQHMGGMDPQQVTTPRHAGFVQNEPPWGYAPYMQAGSLPSAAATASTPSRGFVWQQPAPGSTQQIVGSPATYSPSVVPTRTQYVPAPRPVSYANQTYGPGTPRGFVQQPTPGSTLQIVGSPAIPPSPIVATGTRHVPASQPISYANQTYGPAAPSRGFVQQPTPGSTPQIVRSPAIPPLSVVATGTRHVPTPQQNYYASQNYGPAAPSPEYPKTNL